MNGLLDLSPNAALSSAMKTVAAGLRASCDATRLLLTHLTDQVEDRSMAGFARSLCIADDAMRRSAERCAAYALLLPLTKENRIDAKRWTALHVGLLAEAAEHHERSYDVDDYFYDPCCG
ncbi:MAG: hypothetical protein RLZZ324_1295 [Candidatus Parcubacteria bacterium]|jgi:hypothetical protein